MLRIKDDKNLIAYFSMEIGIDPQIPTYAGGLGILAGDTLRSMADLNIPAVAVTLLSESGYFNQTLNADSGQSEQYTRWDHERFLDKLDVRVDITTDTQQIAVQVWQYKLSGVHGGVVQILFLDTDIDTNTPEIQKITQRLYPSNKIFRLLQEVVLGVGGFKALQALGYKPSVYHLNEGHSAFLTLELLDHVKKTMDLEDPIDYVRNHCVFTTHTPVPAGHDVFTRDMLTHNLEGIELLEEIPQAFDDKNQLNMTRLALSMSNKVNGVAKKHAETSQHMFPNYSIKSITNGVHHTFWTSSPFQLLFEEFIPGWYEDPFALHGALTIPDYRIELAHIENKKALNTYIQKKTGALFSDDVITIGYARRITRYKRPDLLFYDIKLLRKIAEQYPIQIVFAGKAHPEDKVGKSLIQEIIKLESKLNTNIQLVYIPNYDINEAKHIIPGVDIWLNTPKRPLEASGTSGMKASLNGVPSLSVLDGWWLEGHIEGITGWAIGPKPSPHQDGEITCIDCDDSDDLYFKLQDTILPMYYERQNELTRIRKQCIALIGSYFNSHRMVQQYIIKSYL